MTPPGLEHPGRNKQQGPPSPGLELQRTRGGQTPRTGSYGVGQAAGTAAPRTGASRDQRRWTPSGLEHPGRNKQQAPRGASAVARSMRPWRCSKADWRTRPGRSGEDKKRTRPR